MELKTKPTLNSVRELREVFYDAQIILNELAEREQTLYKAGDEDRAYKAAMYHKVIKELMDYIKINESQIVYLTNQINDNGKVKELQQCIQRYKSLCYSHGINPRKNIYY